MSEKDIALLSIKDFLTLKMLKYSLMPLVATLIIMYLLFFVLAGVWIDEMGTINVQSTHTTIENGIPHTQSMDAKLEGSAIIQFLMSYAITSWLATFLIYAIGGFLTIYASIFIALIVVGFLTPFILKELQARHYMDVEMIGHSNAIYTILLALKWAAAMILLFILLIPFYFIPFINIIAINIPLYYFFHKMLKFDISSNIATADEDKQISFFYANRLRIKTVALYLLSLIPFMIFFAAVFYVIYLGHTYFIEVKKLREA